MQLPKGVSFNIKYVKRVGKVEFKKQFSTVYPKLDLDVIYDQIVGRKKKEENSEVE